MNHTVLQGSRKEAERFASLLSAMLSRERYRVHVSLERIKKKRWHCRLHIRPWANGLERSRNAYLTWQEVGSNE